MFYSSAGIIILVSNLTLWEALFCFPSSSERRHLSFERIFESFICIYHSSGLWMMGCSVAWLHSAHKKNLVLKFLLVSCSSIVSTPLHATGEVSKCLLFFPSFFEAVLRVCLIVSLFYPKHLIQLLFLLVQTQSNQCSFLCWKTDVNKSLQTLVPSDFCPEKQVEH